MSEAAPDTAGGAIRCHVSGRVQGVWYRASTRQKALQLGVTGRAVNLDDGSVEVVAFGTPEALAALVEWLWEGPPAARVHAVSVARLPGGEAAEAPPTFDTG